MISSHHGVHEKNAVSMEPSTRRKAMAKDPRIFFSRLVHDHYIVYPLLASAVWLGGILALLGLWVKNGKPQYEAEEATVVFISDVGAHYHKLFIGITAATGGLFILTMFAERWLRHVDRIPADRRRREKVFDWLAIFFAVVGAAGLILLGIFDAFNHSTVHWIMTVVFVVGTALSAIFQSAEVWSLHKDHPDRQHLLRNSIYKLVVVTLAIIVAIAFAVCYGICSGNATSDRCDKITSAAAAFEWAVAFILTFYFLSLVLDLWPAGKSSPRYMRRLARWQEKNEPSTLQHDFSGRPAFAEHPENWQTPVAPAMTNVGLVGERSARPSTTYTYGSETPLNAPVREYAAPTEPYPTTTTTTVNAGLEPPLSQARFGYDHAHGSPLRA